MIVLRVLGTAELLADNGEEHGRVLSQPRQLALLTYMAVARPRGFHRRDSLVGLFWPEATQEQARSSLRQAVHRLREVLPADVELRADDAGFGFAENVATGSESVRFEALLAEAARLQGEQRLDATTRALAIAERGEYLPGLAGAWVDERRERLAILVADARQDAAELAFAAGRYAEAERLRPPGNDDAILRWNTCARILARHEAHVHAGVEGERYVPSYD